MMMSFGEFSEYVRDHILEGWMPCREYETSIREIVKNNGCVVRELQIGRAEARAAPMLELDRFYGLYQSGMKMEDVMARMRDSYMMAIHCSENEKILPDCLEKIGDNIVFQLVNYQKNIRQLESAPHLRLVDLAVVFRWITGQKGDTIASALITDPMMKMWGADIEQLTGLAGPNTEKLFPPLIRKLGDCIQDILPHDDSCLDESDPEVYVLTNQRMVNGASALLYDHILQDFRQTIREDFYIIPSSIHEVLLMPMTFDMKPDDIRKTIREVNLLAVDPRDYLSDSLYCYREAEGEIRIVV